MVASSAWTWRSFTIQIGLFWMAKLWICQDDVTRPICHLVEGGFLPCLPTFPVMDFLVLPWLRRNR